MNNATQRILFALLAGPAFVVLLWMGDLWRQGLLVSLLAVGAWEYGRLLRAKFSLAGWLPEILGPVVVAALALTSNAGPLAQYHHAQGALFSLPFFGILLWAYQRLERDDVFPWVAMTAAGWAFLGAWGSSLLALTAGRPGWESLAPAGLAIGCCWVGDTAAYAVGRAIGRRKLCPGLSPGKTVEGAVAGVLAPMIFSAVWSTQLLGIPLVWALLLGAILGMAGIVGDLLESVLKRWAGAKDSSKLLPGHGGILDRFDSILLVAPMLHHLLLVLQR